MAYADDVYVASIFYCLTREQQAAIQRLSLEEWRPIGESVNEIVRKLERKLDENWIAEYLAHHGNKETD